MSNTLTAGPYVIRNRKKSAVFHAQSTKFNNEDPSHSYIQASTRDENLYRSSQIWWVEPVPNLGEEESETVYYITNTCCGTSVALHKDSRGNPSGGPLACYPISKEVGQAWKLQRVQDNTDGRAYYHIISASTGNAVYVKSSVFFSSDFLYTQKCSSLDEQQQWEFVVPITAFPSGWFQMQNVGSGNVLSHKYAYNPPSLIPIVQSTRPSQYRETWDTQWTLVDANLYNTTPPASPTWCIMNRLTGGFLDISSFPLKSPPTTRNESGVYASGGPSSKFWKHTWKFELDRAHNWTIGYCSTGPLLEETKERCHGGMKVACVDKRLTAEDRNKTWFLTLPVVETTDETRDYLNVVVTTALPSVTTTLPS